MLISSVRKTVVAALTAGAITVGGCTTTQVTDFLSQVQAAAASACLFVPTIETIISVAGSLGIPYVGAAGAAVTTVANAICSKVPPPASARYRALPRAGGGPATNVGTVNGVQINGWRTP